MKSPLTLGLAIAAMAFTAGAATVPVSPGHYVRAGMACADAPNAGRLDYDGTSFTGAHAARCTTLVISIHGRRYVLRSTCRAAGDGSPAAPYTEVQTVTVRSASSFVFAHGAGAGAPDRAVYRRCPPAANP